MKDYNVAIAERREFRETPSHPDNNFFVLRNRLSGLRKGILREEWILFNIERYERSDVIR
jgi:hypothetical protein